ncbi:hypothetical protein [Enterobacter mori]|uniref:hypothetical protein n=1 Tax=Enterobacter mori TaxID=539813 RepID=UPI0032AE880C
MKLSSALLILTFTLITGCNDSEQEKNILEMASGETKTISNDGSEVFTSNENVVKVSGGVITAQGYGTAAITQKKNGKVTNTIDVEVRPFRLYSIGNSHTWDLKPDGDLVTMAKANGIDLDNDWHIYCGHNIDNIIHDPENTCVPPKHNKYKKAINSIAYDAITIEPFFGSTGKAEVDAIESLIDEIRNSKSKNAKIYIYYTWPQNDAKPLDAINYSHVWDAPSAPTAKQKNNNSTFVSYLKNRLDADGYKIAGFIPVGDSLDDLDRSAKNGEINNLTGAGNLYRDYLHMNNVGKLFIAKLYISTIFNINQVRYAEGTYLPGQMPDRDKDLTEHMKSLNPL